MTEEKSLTTPRSPVPFGGEFDQFFKRMMRDWSVGLPDLFTSHGPRALQAFDHVPKVEVKENGKAYTVTVELPGLDEKDVKAQVEDDMLTISGEKKTERTDEKTHYSERSYGSFSRSFTLPGDADPNGVSAKFAKGILTVEIAKTDKPSGKAKQIEVKPA